MKKSILSLSAALLVSSAMFAQFRPTDQTGINVFEQKMKHSLMD